MVLRLRPNDMQMHMGAGREGGLSLAGFCNHSREENVEDSATEERTNEIVPSLSFQRFSPSPPHPLLVIVKRSLLAGGKIAALLLSIIGWMKKEGV